MTVDFEGISVKAVEDVEVWLLMLVVVSKVEMGGSVGGCGITAILAETTLEVLLVAFLSLMARSMLSDVKRNVLRRIRQSKGHALLTA